MGALFPLFFLSRPKWSGYLILKPSVVFVRNVDLKHNCQYQLHSKACIPDPHHESEFNTPSNVEYIPSLLCNSQWSQLVKNIAQSRKDNLPQHTFFIHDIFIETDLQLIYHCIQYQLLLFKNCYSFYNLFCINLYGFQ